MSKKNGQLSMRIWITIILFMFLGAIAGGVENMFISLYLNNTTFKHGTMGARLTLTDTINIIAALTAVVSCITTFVMGTLSEKLKNRKVFISTGYIVWGLVMCVFSLIRGGNIGRYFGLTEMSDIVNTTTMLIIVFSLILAFLRSTTADAAFSSWLTDVSTPQTSAKIEVAFTLMGFVATAVITVLVAKAETGQNEYSDVFIYLGLTAIGIGLLGFYLITNSRRSKKELKENAQTSYWSDLFYGFRPKAIKENPTLYLMLLSGCTFNCAHEVFDPYLFIYLDSVIIPANKGVDLLSAKIVIPVLIALAIIVVSVRYLMKLYAKDKALSFIPSVICFIVGLFIVSSTKHIIGIIIGLTPGLIGYIVIMIQFGATVRDNIPKDKVGLFQGVRMIFLVTIPSIIGPTIGNISSTNSSITYLENGSVKVLPTESMFFFAGIIAIFIFLPMLAFLKKDKEKSLGKKTRRKR